MSFYGESYALDWGGIISGPDWDFYDVRSHFGTDHHVFSAGDSVIIGSYPDPVDYDAFMAFTDIKVQWVIEVLDGAGTFELSAGMDPTWDYDNPALADQALGSYSVTGPTTLVSEPFTPPDTFRFKDAWDSTIVFIECVSGSIDVKQVKLRVWPTAGPSGAWTTTSDTQTVVGTGSVHRQLGPALAGGSQSTIIWGEDAYIEAVGDALVDVRANLAALSGTTMEFDPSLSST